jgi:glycosyltransferase involved in cell wall biosynthesis
LAAGTAVIATTTGGTPEIVINEQSGLLVPPFNPLALAQACITLLDQPPLRNQLAQTGQTVVQHKFNVREQVKEYIAAYESAL